jgi:hypothetical protein
VGSDKLNDGQTRTRAHKCLPRFDPPEGKDLRPAYLTLCYGGVYSEVLQWRRILNLAKGGEHSILQALDGGVNRE